MILLFLLVAFVYILYSVNGSPVNDCCQMKFVNS